MTYPCARGVGKPRAPGTRRRGTRHSLALDAGGASPQPRRSRRPRHAGHFCRHWARRAAGDHVPPRAQPHRGQAPVAVASAPAGHRPPRPRHPGAPGVWRALLADHRLRRRRARSVIGVPLGAVSGFYGGWLDLVIQRVIDVLLSFPGFLLALSLVAVLGVGIDERHHRRRARRGARVRPPGARLDPVDPLARLREPRARSRARVVR